MKAPYRISVEELSAALLVNTAKGLSKQDVPERLNQYGQNKITKDSNVSWLNILISQFKSPIVYLLLIAAFVSFYFQEWLDGAAIMIVIVINALIGFYMEFQAGQSMEALQKLTMIPAKVLRDSKLQEINAEDVVPGDVLFVESGDMVSADARIIKASQLQVNESALTGESVPVDKNTQEHSEETPLSEWTNMILKGTFVSKGNAVALVTTTGMQTELGKIASLVHDADQSATPLEKKLEQFSRRLIKVTVVLVMVIFLTGWFFGHNLVEMLTTSIALAVAAIPEGLPIVATLGLAKGMLMMARHNVIVKKLSSVETLGGTTVICTDKTGTLTENRMTVKSVIPSKPNLEKQIAHACILCSTAEVRETGQEVGDPLETALLKYAAQFESIGEVRSEYLKINEEPFSSETKRMITVHKNSTTTIAYAKGAVEEILNMCDLSGATTSKEKLVESAEQLASAGYKVIALASKLANPNHLPVSQFDFLAIVGLIDPPRKEVSGALAECRSAGINVVMVTGDHPNTAKEIGRQLGIITSQEAVVVGASMRPFEKLSPGEKQSWGDAHVFARVTPAQKLDLIKMFQERGDIVGMTGDGVNDAPALKKADIGIAMGQRGTQVAQDVADMVLKDDSFASIVTAIRQGRIIFDNIRKFVIFLLSCNLSELFTISVTAVLNLHFQIFPLQILFINLITDVLPALALGVTPGSKDVMHEKPRDAKQPIIEQKHWRSILFYAFVIGASSLGAVLYSHFTVHESEGWNAELCNNILFFTLILSQMFHVFNMNASGSSFFRSEIIRNKYVWLALLINIAILLALYQIPVVRTALSIYPLTISDWLIIVGFSLGGMTVNQIAKGFRIIKQ